jgi:hypothetical protein
VNDGVGWAERPGPRGEGIKMPGFAEASVPAPPCVPGTQPGTAQRFPWSGPLKWSTVRVVMLSASPAATTTPSPAANVGVTISLRSAGLT